MLIRIWLTITAFTFSFFALGFSGRNGITIDGIFAAMFVTAIVCGPFLLVVLFLRWGAIRSARTRSLTA